METKEKPPLDVEQALDLILGLAAHTSGVEGQRQFGQLLITEYFVKLRERYQNDSEATRYLDNLLASVSSAVRGFAVARQATQVRWEALRAVQERQLELARRISRYSPLHEEGWFGKLLGGGGGAGAFGLIANVLSSSEWTWLFASLLGMFVGICLLDFVLQRLSTNRMSAIERAGPVEQEETWRKKTIEQYRMILRDFLLTAIKLREEFYPHMTTFNGKKVFPSNGIPHMDFDMTTGVRATVEELEVFLNQLIDRHMSFD